MIARIAGLILAAAFGGAPVSGAPLSVLIERSDAIAIGTERSPVVVGTSGSFFLEVERVFKGPLGTGDFIAVTWDTDGPVQWTGSPSYRGIWFLENDPSGGWRCIPARRYGNTPAYLSLLPFPVAEGPLPKELSYEEAAPLVDKLLLEIAGGEVEDASEVIVAAAVIRRRYEGSFIIWRDYQNRNDPVLDWPA